MEIERTLGGGSLAFREFFRETGWEGVHLQTSRIMQSFSAAVEPAQIWKRRGEGGVIEFSIRHSRNVFCLENAF